MLGMAGLVWAGVSHVIHDFALGQAHRLGVVRDNEAASDLEASALVINDSPHRLLPQFLRPESAVGMLYREVEPKERALIDTFLATGRKVYVSQPVANALLAMLGEPEYRIVPASRGEGQFVEMLPPVVRD
jgi:hypothetical protein